MRKIALDHRILRAIGKVIGTVGETMVEHPILTVNAIALPIVASSLYSSYVKDYGPYYIDRERNNLIRQNIAAMQQLQNQPATNAIKAQMLMQPTLM
jgi:tyrosine-protein phosphatase YwqE